MILLLLLCLCIPIPSHQTDDQAKILCDPNKEVDPFNLSLPYYWPAFWNENMTGPSYMPNQDCKWNINIPPQHFASFIMMADIGTNSTLKITDSNGRSESVMTSQEQPYVFVGLSFTIQLSVGANSDSAHFGFRVQWSTFPKDLPAYYNVSKTSDALVFDEMLGESAVVLTAETQVNLVAFPAAFPDFTPLLRITLVFDGPDINSAYLGNLYQAVRANKPFVSTGNHMTVFTFQENYVVGSFFIIQDNYNVKNLADTRGITCWSQSSCPVTLTADYGPVSAITLNVDDGDEYVKNLDLSSDALLKIYIGARREGDDSNVIVTYDAQRSKTNIPQKFNAEMLTFYLEKGTALVELAEDQNYTRWNDAVSGREGFMTSRSYGYSAHFQDIFEEIGGLNKTDIYQFRLNVTHLDVSNNATLTITCTCEDHTTVHLLSSSSDLTKNEAFVAQGNNLTVYYFTNGTETTGFYLDFQIEKVLQSVSVRQSFIFLTMLIVLLF